jgi:decaprenylphospho-beta-D-erythro-pentofuranosid-2-ulose 2-reductase
VLNGLKQMQNVMIIGGKSEIALEVIKNLPIAENGRIYLLGRDIEDDNFILEYLKVFRVEYDINKLDERLVKIENLFSQTDFDLVILAVGILGENFSKDCLNRSLFETNFSHSAEVLGLIANRLRIQHHGKILIFSSIASVRPRLSNFPYGASKSGLDFFARGLQLTLKNSGVNISIARPGFIFSKMTENLKAAPFAITSKAAGKICARKLMQGKNVFYVPGILKYVSLIIRIIPNSLLKKME